MGDLDTRELGTFKFFKTSLFSFVCDSTLAKKENLSFVLNVFLHMHDNYYSNNNNYYFVHYKI